MAANTFRPEVFTFNFLTATPSGATGTGDISLPPGVYYLAVHGTHTDGGTDPTFLLQEYVDEAQSAVITLPSAQRADTGVQHGAETIAAAAFSVQYYSQTFSVANSQPIVLRHGLKWTWTKNQSTAPNVWLTAVRIG